MRSRITVTISRKLGCGGSYIGQVISSRLKLKYVDREILHLAAQSLGVEDDEVAARQERLTSFFEKMFGVFTYTPDLRYSPPPLRSYTDKQLFDKQTEIMKEIAKRENCVIVGWGSPHCLPHHAGTVTIFLHAPVQFRIRRVMEIYQVESEEQARQMIEESDPLRRKYFTQMTGKDWACADNYHLSIDTSSMPLPEIADLTIEFIKHKLARKHV